jgi:dTDP-4-dehydrorhamnose 3,5-epimerase
MTFHETKLAGAFVIELDLHTDERGFFARTFARETFAEQGLAAEVVQTSIAWNRRAGTIRGMHFQYPPHAEVKLVRCTRGAILDVVVDVRPESATYLQSVAVRLDDETRRSLYVPERFVHGYQVLVDNTEVSYQMSTAHHPESQGGLRWDDPRLGLDWPLPVTIVSPRDREWPLLESAEAGLRAAMTLPATG